MEKQEMLEVMERIFRDVFDKDDITLSMETTPDDVEEWDSLGQMHVLVSIEKEFKIKFGVRDIKNIRSVGDIMNVVAGKL